VTVSGKTLTHILSAYAGRGVLLDTNVLLVYLVGLANPGMIGVLKRTEAYSLDDHRMLRSLVGRFRRLIVTPHVLAELTNLAPSVEDRRVRYFFAHVVRVVGASREVHTEKGVLLNNPALPRFGFADLSVVEAARTIGCLVVTDDFKAAGLLRTSGCAVLNLNHLRGFSWGA